MRVLVCLDAVPAADGTCGQTAYLEQPSILPPLNQEQTAFLMGEIMLIASVCYAFKVMDRSIKR